MSENFHMQEKKPGIFIPFSSAIDFTIKLGPLPIYVIDPKNTAPTQMAFNKISDTPATIVVPDNAVGNPCAKS